ncbi:MAG: hypothetical protein WBN15_07940, partial [Polyangiales bacterium]
MLSLSSHWTLNRVHLSTMLSTFLAVSALLGPSPSSAQAQDAKSQEQRIQELESQVQTLLAEQKAEQKEVSDDQAFTEAAAEQTKEVKGMTPEQLDKFNQGIAAG